MNGYKTVEASTTHDVIKLDDLDRQILRFLQDNAKTTLRDISDRTKYSVNTVKSHLDRLYEQKIIKKMVAVVDCCSIGYKEMLIFSLRINSTVPINSLFDKLQSIESVNCIYQVSGNFPILCIAKCISKDEQIQLLETVKAVPGVEEVITQVVLQRVKEDMSVKIP